MKDDRLKIFVQNEPYQIGVTSTGEPIWVDPKDLIQTPDEKLEQKQNMVDSRFDANVEKIADVVIENAHRFVSETVLNTADENGVRLFIGMDAEGLDEWVQKAGYNVKQDGLTTVIRIKDRVIRSMTADIDMRFREAVAARITQKIVQSA